MQKLIILENNRLRLFFKRGFDRITIFYLLLIIFCSMADAQQYPVYETETIVVTASRIPTTLSDINRSVILIGKDEIERAHARSVPDLLEYVVGVDVKQRGVLGAQADVSIRGGTFEQTLVLIDGVKVNDPQTGHHNMDLPLTLNDIERIEILRGSGSRLYGPDAFGGVINIITKKNEKKSVTIEATLGDYRYSEGRAAFSYPLGASKHRVSLSQKKSSGYRYNTDFDLMSFSYKSSVAANSNEYSFFLGYMDKKFGANSFYSDRFPGQWENTKTTFLNLQSKFVSERITLAPKLYLRSHKDHFMLDKDNPGWFENRHTTNIYGIELHSIFSSRIGLTDFGGEVGNEEIESESLGDHSRLRGALFFEHKLVPADGISIVPGLSGHYYSSWGWNVWPGLDIGFQLKRRMRLYASAGKSFRVPTFTELYYSSPANEGNPNLTSEQAWTYETGLNWANNVLSGNLAIFRRNGRDLIDWVRTEDSEPWMARNVASINTNGAEISVRLNPDLFSNRRYITGIQLNYAFLDSDKILRGLESKYALNHLRHHLQLKIEHNLFHNAGLSWNLRYENRMGNEKHFLLDTQFSLRHKQLEFYVEVSNLLNTDYADLEGVPMPSRWVKAGIKLSQVFGE